MTFWLKIHVCMGWAMGRYTCITVIRSMVGREPANYEFLPQPNFLNRFGDWPGVPSPPSLSEAYVNGMSLTHCTARQRFSALLIYNDFCMVFFIITS